MFSFLKDFITYQKDKAYINKQAKELRGEKINWQHPQTYNDHINIAKIDPVSKDLWIYTDKFEVRKYIKKTIGSQYLNKLYGVYQSADEIDFDFLPNQFVLKATHGSGFNVICKNKANLNWKETKEKLNKWLNINYYLLFRESSYKLIKPQIICEKYLKHKQNEPIDYRFYCWHGRPRIIQVETCPYTKNWKRNLYDLNWQQLQISNFYPRNTKSIPLPSKLAQMIDLATTLSTNFVHARIDFLYVNNKIYFGEITFTTTAGYTNFQPHRYKYLMGKYF